MNEIHLPKTKVAELHAICAERNNDPGELINILHAAQGLFGYLPPEVQQVIAAELNIPVSRVYGVVTFYSFFTMTPKGKYPISVCLGTACYVRGAENVLERAVGNLGLFDDLRQRRPLVALFQKQTDTGAENPLLCGEACRCNRHGGHPLSSFAWYIYHSITRNDIGCKSESAAKMELPAEVPYEKMLGIYKMIYVWHIFFGIFPVF